MLVILDNGHGVNTPGKRSPKLSDGRIFYEWEFNRKVVKRIAELCHENGIRYLARVYGTGDKIIFSSLSLPITFSTVWLKYNGISYNEYRDILFLLQ